MSDISRFRPRAEVDATQRVADFIVFSRNDLTTLVSPNAWVGNVWDVSSSFVRKGKNTIASRLYFFRHGTMVGRAEAATGEPFEQPFADFARAYIRYQHSAAPMTFDRFNARLLALRHLDAGFRSLGRPSDVTKLSADVLFAAVRIGGDRVESFMRYHRAVMLQSFFAFCRDHGFLASPFVWKHGVRKPADVNQRIGEDFAKQRAAKVPGRKAIDVLALTFCEPKNLRDKVMSAVTAVCMCVPIRIHEVLQLRADSGCSDERHNEEDQIVPTFGFRVFPGKCNAPQIKWVPDVMADLAREAFSRLSSIGTLGRTIADWYVRNPDQIYLPPHAEHLRHVPILSAADLGDLVGCVNPTIWANTQGLTPVKSAGTRNFSYRFKDFEQAVLAQLPNDFPLHNGQPEHPYSESLILVRRGSLRADTVGHGSRVMFEPISIGTYGAWLSGKSGRPSVFERYGFVQDDGSPIEHTSHCFRHWLNDVAHRRGMNAMDIANWSGRDPAQNKYYDHQTPAQFHAQLLDMAKKAGGIGLLFEAADALPDPKLMSRAEFLMAQIGSAHQTDLGACIHDYTLLPCQSFGNCLRCEENVFIKGDQKHRASIQERHALAAMQLDAAHAAIDDGDFGADLWVQDHQAALLRLALILSIHDDPKIANGKIVSLPVDGTDTEVSLALRERDAKASLV